MTPETATDILSAVRALGPIVEAAAAEIDAQRCLPANVVEAMRSAGVFRVAFPTAWGGPEMPILEQVEMVETLAYHDASTAWVAMICSDSGHYAGRVDDATAHELYPSMDLLTAGQIYPVGQATRVDGGYRVTGRWQFGSGSLHADRIVGGCLVLVDGAPVMGERGLPEMLVAWLPRDGVTIHDTWHTTGLAASGSNDYSVSDAFVPAGQVFQPLQPGVRPEPLYRYRGFFFANLAAVSIGCARRMLDDLRDLMGTKILMPEGIAMKDDGRALLALGESTAALEAAAAYQADALGSIWDTVVAGDEPSAEQRAALLMMLVHNVQTGQRIAEAVTEVVGAQSIYRSSPFERRRRDLTTVAAHVLGQRKTLNLAARLLMGDEPLVAFA
jgi:alkylation response protein AidB-like acyl-CoA dehydrogenase